MPTARRPLPLATGLALLGTLLTGGCPTDATDIDLAERGGLRLTILRVAESAVAEVTAEVFDADSIFETPVRLGADQELSVNDDPLTPTPRTTLGLDAIYTAEVSAVAPPSAYTLMFDNAGAATSAMVTPPASPQLLAPLSSATVRTSGFTVRWIASDDPAARINITLSGQALQTDGSGGLTTVPYSAPFTALADDGSFTISADDLTFFLAGQVRLTISREFTVERELGFSSARVQLVIARDITITLAEDDEP